ncbi:hypothetical protein GCM10025865_07390 [Paraoerskovia sediminicola]|uniref:CAAX prenyl protease 2/Lysostaphin resistance protein A-like domain-containing protein n=1 Tax=Paraoerskovia sediminicola TaxID=1138587 RepID=A0ABN6X9B4_9CELL|nr:CPBP family intramembrane glutamic endopeptidase [Paraoerskovia sediminicola]BDZ41440.1 hypothetical protein GCM10025865_07390 [Paraoerskovia sediminicola]
MAAPAVGALCALLFGRGHIRWGRPGWWLLAGLLPTVVALAAFLIASSVGWITEDAGVLTTALIAAPLAIASACTSALGEEIGWRGFLWPALRERWGFLLTALVVMVVWWLYHLPAILLGWYGSIDGLLAFTVAVAGISLFLGVLTDRSRSLWPSVVAHGAWNALVATSFAVTEDTGTVPAFAGSSALLGEFGWLAAVSMIALGVVAAAWHLARGGGARRPVVASPGSDTTTDAAAPA